jgi:hypothetical protein
MSVNKRLIGAGATDTGGGGGAITPSNHFNTILYTGNGGSQSIGGLNFSPDLVWIKDRGQSREHIWSDSSRGSLKELSSSAVDAEENRGVFSFDSSGFSFNDGNTNYNSNGQSYVAWCFHANGGNTSSNTNGTITSTVQANDAAGFSIVKYVGDGNSARTVGHGLSAKCDLVIIKDRDHNDKWIIQTPQLGDNARTVFVGGPAVTNDSTTAQAGNDTVFGIGGDNSVNKSGDNFIAYCFRNIEGYQKIGTYTGSGSQGNNQTIGFKASFIIIKNTSNTGDWRIFDSKRGTDKSIRANIPDAEYDDTAEYVTFNSTEFYFDGANNSNSDINANGNTYLYLAIGGDAADETPTIAESFTAENWGGSDYAKNIMNNFRAGLVITRAKGEAHHWGWFDIVRGVGKWLATNRVDDQESGSYGPSAYNAKNTEFYGNFSPSNSDYLNETYNGWFIKAAENTVSNSNGSITTTVSANAAAGFSIVQWTGTGSAGTLGHGLSAAPKFVIYKSATSNGEWVTWHTSYGGGDKYMYLNQNGAVGTQSSFYDGNPTSTVIYIGNHSDINASGQTCMAYCFTDISGFSSFGSYTGTGSLQTITTGFTPDFVVVKKTNATGEDWAVFSSYDLGMTLNAFNQTQAQQSFSNHGMFSETNGFKVPSTSGMTNGSGQSYIYWAMKKNVTQDNTTQYNFNIKSYTGNGSANHYIDGFDFRPDLVITKATSATGSFSWFDSVRGAGNKLDSTETSQAVQNGATLQSFAFDGFTFGNETGNTNGQTNISFAWRAGRTWLVNNNGNLTSLANANQSAGFSVVKYQGTANGSAKTIGHGLSSAPEFVIIKDYEWSTPSWFVYHKDLSNTNQYLRLESSNAEDTLSSIFGAAPTSSVINVGNDSGVGDRADNYIAYCFHSVSGKRKFGTYTGNGSTQSITGLGFQPDFLMIKQINGSNAWRVFNSQSGLSGKTLFFNLTSAIDTESNTVSSFDSDGWTMGSQQGVNDNGDTYIYWAEKIH